MAKLGSVLKGLFVKPPKKENDDPVVMGFYKWYNGQRVYLFQDIGDSCLLGWISEEKVGSATWLREDQFPKENKMWCMEGVYRGFDRAMIKIDEQAANESA